MSQDYVSIYDSTLRDGAQAAGISFSSGGKIRFAKALDDFGIDFVEGGYAGSNEKDMQFFRDIKKEKLHHTIVAAFGSTRRADKDVEADPFVQALIEADTAVCTIYGKTWKLHVAEVLKTTPENNAQMIADTVGYLRSKGRRVFFDAEHFFDGYKDDPAFALAMLDIAVREGAEGVILCDTNGGTLPHEIAAVTSEVCQRFHGGCRTDCTSDIVTGRATASPPSRTTDSCCAARRDAVALPRAICPTPFHGRAFVGIHAHNDGGTAVANSLEAVCRGATQVQGCINGYGERTGNANLTVIIPNLIMKMGIPCLCGDRERGMASLTKLRSLSLTVDDVVNQRPDVRMPYIGEASFTHKAGAHVAGVQKNPKTFEHVDPATVGNERKILVSELAGGSNVMVKMRALGGDYANASREDVRSVLDELKRLESQGYSFESADGSFRLLVEKALNKHRPFFTLEGFNVSVEKPSAKEECASVATVRLRVKDVSEEGHGTGNGPVDALDHALRSVLARFYPAIAKVTLMDYHVRILDPSEATAAMTRVVIESGDGTKTWSTVGVSHNIIEASWEALVDSMEYKLFADESANPKASG